MEVKTVGLKFSKLKRMEFTKQGKLKTSSTIEKLAYNNAAKYEFDGKTFNYQKKQIDDHIENFLVLPNGTETEKNKIELFTELEEKFKKSEAYLASNYIIALPRELDYETNRKIITEMVQEWADKKGNFIDISFHIKNKGQENENPHCHLLEARRTIDKTGQVGNALRPFDNKLIRELDDINNIRADLAKRFNTELRRQNKDVIYTDLSNEKFVEKAIKEDNIEQAILKNYEPMKSKRNREYDSLFYKRQNSRWVKELQEKAKQRREEAKARAEKYKKDLADLKFLELQQKELQKQIEIMNNFKSDYILEEFNKIDLDNFLERQQQAILNLRKDIEDYEQEDEANKRRYAFLVSEFYKATQEKLFDSKKDIKQFFKNAITETRKEEWTEDIAYQVDLLSYQIFRNQEKYIDKAQFNIYRNIKAQEKERYNLLIDKIENGTGNSDDFTEEEWKFLAYIDRKQENSKKIFRGAVDDLIELNLSEEDFNKYVSIVVEEHIKANDYGLSDIEKKYKQAEVTNYIKRNFDSIKQNKEEWIKKNEEWEELRIKSKEEREEFKNKLEEIKENSSNIKEAKDLLSEVVSEHDDNLRLIMKYMNINTFLNEMKQQEYNDLYNGYKR
ncbi:TraA; conjugal transfer protein TraA [Actinobacillus minor 202]|uniref:TraA conjugal transfer protein TraA n=1 Tax=Actinobacillus minor 202 TaxID=591023 RepID=A0ABM9YTF3_9PAST|nr:MobA/MobL family protein [Actinobacillus minor]EEV24585.1 TraA; conjugal transfer protein TraA [Actinobacillus minor 202]